MRSSLPAAIAFGGLLGIPTAYVLVSNAVNIGVDGGYLATCGKTGQFFTLILPHGMLELTAVFIAGATGLRMGWRDASTLARGAAPRPSRRKAAPRGRLPSGSCWCSLSAARSRRSSPLRAAAVGAPDDRRAGRGRHPAVIVWLGRRARDRGAIGDLAGWTRSTSRPSRAHVGPLEQTGRLQREVVIR